MRIAVDCFHFVGMQGGAGGAGAYVRSLVRQLACRIDLELIVSPESARNFTDILEQGSRLRLHVGNDGHAATIRELKDRTDILYAPFTELPERETYQDLFCVSAIHDLQHRIAPGFFPKEERLHRDEAYLRAATQADAILTFSETEKANIRTLAGGERSIGVVPHAPFLAEEMEGENFGATNRYVERFGEYLVYPAVNWPHKNHFRLLEAMRMLGETPEVADLKLVLTGADCVEPRHHFYRELQEFPSVRDRIISLGFVSSRQLVRLLQGARAMVFPSLYEGFGIPVLEAMRLGTPVIATDLPVFRDWFSGSYIPMGDGLSARTMADQIGAALHDGALLKEVRSRGLKDSENFSSSRMAEETLAFFESAKTLAVRSGSRSVVPAGVHTLPGTPQHLLLHIDLGDLSGGKTKLKDLMLAVKQIRASFGPAEMGFHFFVPDSGGASLKLHRQLLEIGQVSSYRKKQAGHRSLVARWFVNHYEWAKFHCFMSCEDLVELVKKPGLLGKLKPNFLRPDVSIDAYCVSDEDWAVLRKDLQSNIHADPFTPEKAIAKLSGSCGLYLALSDQYAREVHADIFSPTIVAGLAFGGRVREPLARFIYVETELVRYMGHHFGLVRSICAAASTAGYACVVGANREWSAPVSSDETGLSLFPCFSSFASAPDPATTPSNFANELSEFFLKAGIGGADIVYLHMPYPTLMLGILQFVVTSRLEDIPNFRIRICSADESFRWHEIRQSSVIKAISGLGGERRRKIGLFVESAVLQEEFLKSTGFELPLLLNPVGRDLSLALVQATRSRRARSEDHPFVFGYFGEAREEKGFHLLSSIVEGVIAQLGAENVRFLIQTSASPQNETEKVMTARNLLENLSKTYGADRTVQLFDEFSSMGAFYGALSQCDAVLLPYDPVEYRVRGSGIAHEALVLGAVIVVSPGTDMATTFEGPGVAVPEAYTASGFVEACCRLVGQQEAIPARIADYIKASPLFLSEQDFVQSMVACAPSPYPEAPAEKPVAIWIGNDVLRQGVSTVYDAQHRFLEKSGYEVYNLYVPYPDGSGHLHTDESLEKYLIANSIGWNQHGYCFDSYSWTLNQFASDSRQTLLQRISSDGPSFELMSALNEFNLIPSSLERLLSNRKISLVCLNYVHLFPVLEKLGLDRKETLVVLETHDIQAYQHAIRGKRPVDYDEMDQELARMRDADKVVAISRKEEAEIRQYDPDIDVQFILPSIDVSQDLFADWIPGASGLDGDVLEVWMSRPDLRDSFDLRSPASLRSFRQWMMLHGAAESAAVAQAVRRLRRGKQIIHEEFPAAPGCPDIDPFLGAIWGSRPDLQEVFPNARNPKHSDREALLAWFGNHGVVEYRAALHIGDAGGDESESEASTLLETFILARSSRFEESGYRRRMKDWLSRHRTLDILLVASDHPSNVLSVKWFINAVYEPLLAPKGFSLVIAGRSCVAIDSESLPPSVHLAYEVDYLEPLYSAARVVSCPVIGGAGTPIKILDALARGLCVSVSDFVDQAIRLSDFGFPLAATAIDFAEDIIRLLEFEEARAERICLAKKFADEYLSPSGYDEAWKKLIS